ncbi:MAG: RsmB/NOP family class I SAM-dependent RNA methyltransferase [Erysipelotrichales bacterium]|nr:RsmB/NOP family class I SAM-dependent RNA methyltransferase [Erysipelotrichales bacterium]
MDKIDKEFLFQHLSKTYGDEYLDKIIAGLNKARVTTFRVNVLKSNKEEVESSLSSSKISYTNVNNILNAYIVNEGSIKDIDLYQDGEIYIQSLSSMLPPIVLNPLERDHILDMAAAPGSKTSQIAALTNNKACITAVEMNPLRAERLKYNLNKLGVTRTTVLVKDARLLDDFYRFDKILLDAPCSGSGTINLNEETKQKINIDVIKKCQSRQIALLKKGLTLLPKNGELVYSTCSIFKDENEEVIKKVLNKNVVLVPIELPGIANLEFLPSMDGTITVMPNEYFEGFFLAKLKKISS